jgi:hypothetical protein
MSNSLRGLLIVLLTLAALARMDAASPASEVLQFSSPSRGIGCVYANFGTASLRCDVRGGVVPLPARDPKCSTEVDWGQGFVMGVTGRAQVVCAGDTAMGSNTVVAYGTTWRYAGFVCASSTDGMRCTNKSGHGFFISRGQAYRF